MLIWFTVALAAPEWCDGTDNDGDGAIDEGPHLVFVDADGDGFADPDTWQVIDGPCQATDGFPPTDCDDTDSTLAPDQPETCNGVDDDCNSSIDDGFTTCAGCARSSFGDSRYLRCGFLTGLRTWPDALSYCQDRDYPGLAVPDDLGESDHLIADTFGLDRWIGLEDQDGDGGFLTWDGITPPFLDWGTDQPDSSNSCGFYQNPMGEPFDGMWDEACDEAKGWFCETTCTARTWYLDGDGDGFGDGPAVPACEAPPHHVATSGDCDDADPDRHPTASEICNGIDDDCDGVDDDGAAAFTTWYEDADDDGHGDPLVSVEACVAPAGYVDLDDDCAPSDPDVSPSADELCNGADDDCDGDLDEADGDVLDAVMAYPDSDDDGFGDPSGGQLVCTVPQDFVTDGTDCDDSNSTFNPGATEICNGFDDDCDTAIDDADDDVTGTAWYDDDDDDGFGDPGNEVVACNAPPGFLADGTDCDDAESTVFPGAQEVCNGFDDDCDTLIDDDDPGVDAPQWRLDQDGDGYGSGPPVSACSPPPDHTATPGDCDDTDAAVSPAGTEVCNGLDDDCDGHTDDEDSSLSGPLPTWYPDADGDTYGSGTAVLACSAPPGHVANHDDCDDTDPAVNPDSIWYADADGDGFGDPNQPASACLAPGGTVSNDQDCDDTASQVFPGADERCNTIDDDCDAQIDEDPVDGITYFSDADGDGFGNPDAPLQACSLPPAATDEATDCDDGDSNVFPGAPEIGDDGIDQDCDELDAAYTYGNGAGCACRTSAPSTGSLKLFRRR